MLLTNLSLTDTQKEYVLQMLERLFPKEVNVTTRFVDNGLIVYHDKKPPIHWFELISYHFIEKLFPDKIYWHSRYSVKCIEPLTRTIHPVDFLYEKYLAFINNETMFPVTTLEYVSNLENKAKSKGKDKSAVKSSKKEVKPEKAKEVKPEDKEEALFE